ncbi:c-type cytochrome [Deinococcus radiotolerans]|nr:c-type cytochrome [Deinococcus radiotolerans]
MNAPQSTPARRDPQRPDPQPGEAAVTRRRQWVRGSVASWGLGATLGVILGVGLLIATPKLMGKPAEATPASTAPANTNENGAASGMASSGQGSSDSTSNMTTSTQNSNTVQGSGEQGSTPNSGGASSDSTASTDTQGDSAGSTTGSMSGETTTPAEGASSTAGETAAAQSGSSDAPGNPEAGQTIFAGNCAGCHGANGQGQVGPSLVTADGPKSWTLAQFTTTLRDGKTPDRQLGNLMPRFGEAQISDTQVADLQAYIKTLN